MQSRIHTGFHRVTEIDQIFQSDKETQELKSKITHAEAPSQTLHAPLALIVLEINNCLS